MGQPQSQLNPYVDNTEVQLSTLNATPRGTTDTGVLRFDTGILSEGATGIRFLSDAALGTRVEVHRTGLYLVAYQCTMPASQVAMVGISLDATNLTGNPVAGAGGILAAQLYTTPAATTLGVSLMHPVPVRVLTAGIALIRLHATDGSGNPMAAGALTAATARVVVRRLTGLT